MTKETYNPRGSNFEQLVQQGQIELSPAPNNVVEAEVGQEVNLRKGSKAYSAGLLTTEEGQKLSVDTTNPRFPRLGKYKVVFRGPAAMVEYKDPKSKQNVIGDSGSLQFTVLEKIGEVGKKLEHPYRFAFYDPR